MTTAELSNEILPELAIEFNIEITNKSLRLNADAVNRILKTIYGLGYVLIDKKEESNLQYNSLFDAAINQWAQIEDNQITYIDTDQLLFQLRADGWTIIPSGDVSLAE